MSTTVAGKPTRGMTAFEPENGETSMKWEPNDEVVLNAALRNRLSGDLEVDYDLFAAKSGLSMVSVKQPWATVRRKLKEPAPISSYSNPKGLRLSLHERRHLATLYQSIKPDSVDSMIIDYDAMALDLGVTAPEAQNLYENLKFRLTAAPDAYNFNARPTTEAESGEYARTSQANDSLKGLHSSSVSPTSQAEHAFPTAKRQRPVLEAPPMAPPRKLGRPIEGMFRNDGYFRDYDDVILKVISTAGPFSIDWDVLQEQSGLSRRKLYRRFSTAVERRGYKYRGGATIVEGEEPPRKRPRTIPTRMGGWGIVKTANGSVFTQVQSRPGQQEDSAEAALSEPQSSGNTTQPYEGSTIPLAAPNDDQGPLSRAPPVLSSRLGPKNTYTDSWFLELCFRYMTNRPKIDFDAVASEIGMQRTTSAINRFWNIIHRVGPSWAGRKPDYIPENEASMGLTSSTDKEYLEIYFRHILEKPSVELEAVAKELGIATATARNRFYKIISEIKPRFRYGDSAADSNADVGDSMAPNGTRMATRSSTNSSRRPDYQNGAEDDVDDEQLYYESSLAEDENANTTEDPPYQYGTATGMEQHGPSAPTTRDMAPSHKSSARQSVPGPQSEWTDAEFLLACLKHTTQKPAIDFIAVGKVFDWQSLNASNGRFSRMMERLGPRWNKELHHTRAVDKTPTIWNEKFLEAIFKHMTELPKIDFESVAIEVGMLSAELASDRFGRVVRGRLQADWCSGSALASGTAKTAPIPGSTHVETPHRSDATAGDHEDDGFEKHKSAMPAEKHDKHAMRNEENQSSASPDGDADSLYSETEYLEKFQQDLTNSAATKVKLEENNMDLDLWDEYY